MCLGIRKSKASPGTAPICRYTALRNTFHGCESVAVKGDVIWQKASGLCQIPMLPSKPDGAQKQTKAIAAIQ